MRKLEDRLSDLGEDLDDKCDDLSVKFYKKASNIEKKLDKLWEKFVTAVLGAGFVFIVVASIYSFIQELAETLGISQVTAGFVLLGIIALFSSRFIIEGLYERGKILATEEKENEEKNKKKKKYDGFFEKEPVMIEKKEESVKYDGFFRIEEEDEEEVR